ncbi:MAG: hypothetical protein GEV03_11365 [Streptosporangiales bacterium]|nr:hypothetical protein [Streptosporangiales bacterium]
MRIKAIHLTSALALTLLLAACGGGEQPPTSAANPTGTPTPTPTDTSDPRPAGVPARGQQVEIAYTIGGDTLKLSATEPGRILRSAEQITVRLLAIDAPQTKRSTESAQCYGKRATRALKRLLPSGSQAWVQRDEKLRDQHDRYLLYVWNNDGVFVNLRTAQRGYANAVPNAQNDRYWDRIFGAEQKAQQAGKGLWGSCDHFGAPVEPPKPPAPPAPDPDPAIPDKPKSDRNCAPGYSPCVPPYPPDKDCQDVLGPVIVTGSDPHDLDRDGDGIACET